jgi:hypothetical protein
MKYYFFFFLLAIATFTACKDDDPVNATGIEGDWRWTQSYGGLLGQTITPDSAGYTRHLEIDSETYREFQDDSLIFQSNYNIETRVDSLFGTNKIIAFDTGYELAIIQSGNNLKLIEICFDCFEHSYVRQ